MDLSSDNLLKRSLHRQTQKNSEANINEVIWEQCTKDGIFGRTIVEIISASAAIYVIVIALVIFMKVKKPSK